MYWGEIVLYAYNYRTAERVSYTRVNKRRVNKQKVVRHKVIKKQNLILNFLSRLLVLAGVLAIAYFVLPQVFDRIYYQTYIKQNIRLTTEPVGFIGKSGTIIDSKVDVRDLVFPLTSKVCNTHFMGEYFVTPVNTANREISSLYLTNKLTPLENKLRNLMKSYPMIKPGIFVWEYDSGNYIGINENEVYPAASIIKIPVLIRMFKSIEANQFTIYDEMYLTDYYRSSGSGDLQYKQSGLKLTIDELAHDMITTSDNTATNMLMSKMGSMEDVNAGLRDWGLNKTRVNNWLPDLDGTNTTTAMEMAKLLYNLDNPGFLNITSREAIIDYMSHVKNNRLIQAGIDPKALFVHKTGDIGTMLGDAGIVYAPNGKRYIVVILANRPFNHPAGKEFIQQASKIIYDDIVK